MTLYVLLTLALLVVGTIAAVLLWALVLTFRAVKPQKPKK